MKFRDAKFYKQGRYPFIHPSSLLIKKFRCSDTPSEALLRHYHSWNRRLVSPPSLEKFLSTPPAPAPKFRAQQRPSSLDLPNVATHSQYRDDTGTRTHNALVFSSEYFRRTHPPLPHSLPPPHPKNQHRSFLRGVVAGQNVINLGKGFPPPELKHLPDAIPRLSSCSGSQLYRVVDPFHESVKRVMSTLQTSFMTSTDLIRRRLSILQGFFFTIPISMNLVLVLSFPGRGPK